MKCRALLRDERGASLLLALGFLTFMGVFSVAILGFTSVGSLTSAGGSTTDVADVETRQLWAADLGMAHGIAALAADDDAELCATSGSTSSWTKTVNQVGVTYGCEYVSGGTTVVADPPPLGEYGAIIGSSGITYGTATASNVGFAFQGDVHSTGAITFGHATRQTMTIAGDLTVGGTCPTTRVTYTSGGVCTGASTPPTLPTVQPYVPSAMAAAPTTTGGCTTLYPGKYGGTGGQSVPTFAWNGSYYLASGVYYLDGVTMLLQGTVFGGAKGATETKLLPSTVNPCRTSDPTGTGYTGSGVTFVIGGAGTLQIGSTNSRPTNVELYSRVPGGLDVGSTPALGIWAGASSSLLPGSGPYTNATSAAKFLTTNHNQTDVIHGMTYLASSPATMFMHSNSTAGSASVFTGGLIASGLSVSVSNSTDGNKTMPVARLSTSSTFTSTSTPRVVTLTSTAADTTITATVEPDSSPPVVTNWQVGQVG